MPNFGDRVYVRPAAGLQVQRAVGMYGQFLPEDGAEVVWDEFHHARLADGSIGLRQPRPASPAPDAPAPDEVP